MVLMGTIGVGRIPAEGIGCVHVCLCVCVFVYMLCDTLRPAGGLDLHQAVQGEPIRDTGYIHAYIYIYIYIYINRCPR